MNCAFCEIPENKERMIIENDSAWAFLTDIPIVPGHTLIVPKNCVPTVSDLTNEEQKAIFDLIEKLKKGLKNSFNSKGFNFAWNENKVAGQEVAHFHLHMLPRRKGDKGVSEHEPRKFLYRPGSREKTTQGELKEIVELIKTNL